MPTVAVFDSNVFDTAIFDSFDAVPVLFKVRVDPLSGIVAPGQHVPITATLVNTTISPGLRYLFTLAEPPRVEIHGPVDSSGVTVFDSNVFDTNLFKVRVASSYMTYSSQGVYTFIFIGKLHDAPGVYSGVFTASNGEQQMITPEIVLFTIQG